MHTPFFIILSATSCLRVFVAEKETNRKARKERKRKEHEELFASFAKTFALFAVKEMSN